MRILVVSRADDDRAVSYASGLAGELDIAAFGPDALVPGPEHGVFVGLIDGIPLHLGKTVPPGQVGYGVQVSERGKIILDVLGDFI